MKFVRTGNFYADMYCSLIPAMLLGRVVGGIAQALFLMGSGQPYTLAMWATVYLAQAVPGIILHLVLVPALAAALTKAGLIPVRYARNRQEQEASA